MVTRNYMYTTQASKYHRNKYEAEILPLIKIKG